MIIVSSAIHKNNITNGKSYMNFFHPWKYFKEINFWNNVYLKVIDKYPYSLSFRVF